MASVSKFMSFFNRYVAEPPPFPLEHGEIVLKEGVGALHKGMFGADWAPLVLTDKRLLWITSRSIIPFFADRFEVVLTEVRWVDQGNLLYFIFGGWCIRIRMKSGRIRRISEGDGQLKQWISAIRLAAANAQNVERLQPDPIWFRITSTSTALAIAGAGLFGLLYLNGWIGVFCLTLSLIGANLTSRGLDYVANPLSAHHLRR